MRLIRIFSICLPPVDLLLMLLVLFVKSTKYKVSISIIMLYVFFFIYFVYLEILNRRFLWWLAGSKMLIICMTIFFPSYSTYMSVGIICPTIFHIDKDIVLIFTRHWNKKKVIEIKKEGKKSLPETHRSRIIFKFRQGMQNFARYKLLCPFLLFFFFFFY